MNRKIEIKKLKFVGKERFRLFSIYSPALHKSLKKSDLLLFWI